MLKAWLNICSKFLHHWLEKGLDSRYTFNTTSIQQHVQKNNNEIAWWAYEFTKYYQNTPERM